MQCRRRSPLRIADQAAARLAAVEAGFAQQRATLEELSRQVDKLQTRTRLVSRDVHSPLRALQASAAEQTQLMVAATSRIDKLERDMRDAEALVGGVQELSAKQFQLLAGVLRQPKAGARRAEKASGAPSAKAAPVAAPAARQGNASSSQTAQASPGGSMPAAGRAATGGAMAAAARAAETLQAGGRAQKDEWGRQVAAAGKSRPGQQTTVGSTTASSGSGGGGLTENEAQTESDTVQVGDAVMRSHDDGSVSFSF